MAAPHQQLLLALMQLAQRLQHPRMAAQWMLTKLVTRQTLQRRRQQCAPHPALTYEALSSPVPVPDLLTLQQYCMLQHAL
jgi:hypothetical protein